MSKSLTKKEKQESLIQANNKTIPLKQLSAHLANYDLSTFRLNLVSIQMDLLRYNLLGDNSNPYQLCLVGNKESFKSDMESYFNSIDSSLPDTNIFTHLEYRTDISHLYYTYNQMVNLEDETVIDLLYEKIYWCNNFIAKNPVFSNLFDSKTTERFGIHTLGLISQTPIDIEGVNKTPRQVLIDRDYGLESIFNSDLSYFNDSTPITGNPIYIYTSGPPISLLPPQNAMLST